MLHRADLKWMVGRLLFWFESAARNLPWRRTSDPYGIWVSEIMLQQTQVKTVWPYWERWMNRLPNIQALAEASSQEIHKLWEGLGYYSRVRNLHKAAGEIVSDHQGEFPSDFDAVLELPGIGPYTAGAICSIAFDQPKPIIDGNIMRVFARLFCLKGDPHKPPANQHLWKLSEEFVACAARLRKGRTTSRNCSRLNQSLMELGALICTTRQPRCDVCPLRRCCQAYQTGRVAQFPELPKRQKPTRILSAAFVVCNRGRFLIRQRPSGVVNGHLWEFPNRPLTKDLRNLSQLASLECAVSIRRLDPLFTIHHSITRYRHTLEVFKAKGASKNRLNTGDWMTFDEMKRLPFSSAHKKILSHLITNSTDENTHHVFGTGSSSNCKSHEYLSK
jgi:A/G-specific adenine glycosylase